ncbi:MAG: hypothetical protein EBU90_02270 [Proteobacteria bacterium]|nr:hypothetical protein [Pseudomonadota bacterium]NBP13060.1 hypothetical protein [bacterium]
MLLIGELWANKDITNHIVALTIAFVTGVLSPIIASWAKAKFAAKRVHIEEEETDEILKLLKTNEVVDNKIENFRNEHSLDRVWIAQFHNGGSFYPADSVFKFQKFSLTYEACKVGIASDLSVIQNIPVSVFAGLLKKIKEEGHYGVNDIANAPDDGMNLKSFWADRGVKGFHISAIKCLRKKFLGFIVMERVIGDVQFDHEIIESLIIESRILGGYLVRGGDLQT